MRLQFILLPCTLLLAFLPAHADDASKLAKAEELFKVAHIDQLTAQIRQQTFDQLKAGIVQQLLGVELSPDQQKNLDEFSVKLEAIIEDGLGWKVVEPEYAKLYAATYTEDEIDGILAFYKSPSGQAMIEKTPGLVRQSSAITQSHLKLITPQIQDLMKQFTAEMNATNQSKKTN